MEGWMREVDRVARNRVRLQELYPTFGARLARVIVRLERAGLRPRIQDAWRSPADQLAAYKAGNSKLTFGFHNVTGAGGKPEALAADVLDDDFPLNSRKSYLLRLAAAAEAEGLVTGIRWGVPRALIGRIDAAIAAGDFDADIKLGWDPTHVEPRGLSVAEAKAGKRPA
jgi:hypothetical protein